jgi:hypothetical protein
VTLPCPACGRRRWVVSGTPVRTKCARCKYEARVSPDELTDGAWVWSRNALRWVADVKEKV